VTGTVLLFSRCQDQPSKDPRLSLQAQTIQSVLWQQHAAEYRALVYQSYNTARQQLDVILSHRTGKDTPPAIIADIDETVLDNSPFNGKLIMLDTSYSKPRWIEWGKLAAADTLPGAAAFFRYAAQHGVEVFYISNRLQVQMDETMANLRRFGLPFADAEHVLLKSAPGGKEPRRRQVMKHFEPVLLLGDNLSDFSALFDKQGTKRRNALVDSLRNEFGRRFIVFPNPVYGDWESQGIYEGRYDWTPFQMDSLRRHQIIAY
jgi:5'-nucleotidase (lipoprotein e(P4) family)